METECCGIREMNGVMDSNNAEEAVTDAAQNWFEGNKEGAFIFFSVIDKAEIGDEIAEHIVKNQLGSVVKMRPTLNPNSENILTMFVWTVNKSNFKSFWHKTERYKKHYKDDNNW